MQLPAAVAAGAAGYLLGTIPVADVVARTAPGGPVDLRKVGSGNPGAANVTRVLGRRAGAQVAAADVLKGFAATLLGAALAGPTGAQLGGCAAVVGHCFPVWRRFRGGKGVAAAVGQCLATVPAAVPLALGAAVVRSRLGRRRGERPGAGPATWWAAGIWVAVAAVWWRADLANPWGPNQTMALPIGAAVSSAIVLFRFGSAPPVPASGAST